MNSEKKTEKNLHNQNVIIIAMIEKIIAWKVIFTGMKKHYYGDYFAKMSQIVKNFHSFTKH